MSTNQQSKRVGDRIRGHTKSWPKDPGLKHDEENHLGSDAGKANGSFDGTTYRREVREHTWGWSCYASWGEGFYETLARHEHYLAANMGLKPGMRVLEIGFGTGGSAREIATYSGAHVVGLNNNERQTQDARRNTKRAGLERQVEIVEGDNIYFAGKFGENSFDAVYVIEPKYQAPSLEVYSQIQKVLKPGGVFGVYAWCMTDAWDPSIPSHKELAHQLKEFAPRVKEFNLFKDPAHLAEIWDIIPESEMRTFRDLRQALTDVGFKIEHEEDLAERPDALPWYYPLRGDVFKARMPWQLLTTLSTSWIGKLMVQGLRLIEMTGLVADGTWEACETLRNDGDALIKGVQTKLFTPIYLVIARKPLRV